MFLGIWNCSMKNAPLQNQPYCVSIYALFIFLFESNHVISYFTDVSNNDYKPAQYMSKYKILILKNTIFF